MVGGFYCVVRGKPASGQKNLIYKNKKTKKSFVVTKDATDMAWFNHVRIRASQAWGDTELMEGALELSVNYYRPYPQSFSLKKKRAALAGHVRPITRPDLDNYTKVLCDALNDIVYKDDAQIVDMNLSKRYADSFYTEILITHVEQMDVLD